MDNQLMQLQLLTQKQEERDLAEIEREKFTLLNSFWFVIASLLQQGTDILPR